MGTRTAIFQQQENGEYKGIYVHYDGYVEGVGAMLHLAYQDRAKVSKLINNEKPLSNLGATGELIDTTGFNDPRRKETTFIDGEELPRYSEIVDDDEGEYYITNTVSDIIHGKFFTYNSKGELQTYRSAEDNREYPLQGSDNNGFYYIQGLDGEWDVAIMIDDGTWKMKSLNDVFAK